MTRFSVIFSLLCNEHGIFKFLVMRNPRKHIFIKKYPLVDARHPYKVKASLERKINKSVNQTEPLWHRPLVDMMTLWAKFYQNPLTSWP